MSRLFKRGINEFPVPAGMNRKKRYSRQETSGVPRTCGDEPLGELLVGNDDLSSPYLRG